MATENGKLLMQQLLDAGYPKEEIFHHESDLYVYATPLTRQVIDRWLKENGYQKNGWSCQNFTDQITGRAMYDIPFQYIPWWEEKSANRRTHGLNYYTVYLAKDDEIAASGTSLECARQLKISIHSFYSIVSRFRSGKRRKYIIVIEKNIRSAIQSET